MLGQTTLVELELRTDHDDRTARVVHALTQEGSGGNDPAYP